MKDNIEYYDFNPTATECGELLAYRASKQMPAWAMVIGYDADGDLVYNCANPNAAERLLLIEKVRKSIIEGI